MTLYAHVRERPRQFLACTSLEVAEFDLLVAAFSQAWESYRDDHYVNNGGGRPKLQTMHDKLFFILVYHKVYPIQSAMGALFGMSQSQVCHWIHVLSPVLRTTLGIKKCLPERKPKKLTEVLEQCALQDFVIDGTERKRQRPVDTQDQKDFYSGKKKAHTYNNIIIADTNTHMVQYLSQTYEGSYHDKAICDAEQPTFPEHATLHKDRGFQGYEPEGVITYQPQKNKRG
jgi:Helix-turn-helix of DDE superfamily endonuclease/DDE superfamily endonuclease